MGERVPESIRGAMSPMFLANWLIGIGIIEYPRGRQRTTVSTLWILSHIIGLMIGFGVSRFSNEITHRNRTIFDWNLLFLNNCSVISVVIEIILNVTSWKKSGRWIYQIDAVNEKLKKLGISGDHALTFKTQIIGLTMILVVSLLAIIVNSVYLIHISFLQNVPHICYWISVYYQLTFGLIGDTTFCFGVRYIHNRLRRLNEYLVQSATNDESPNSFVKYIQQPVNTARRINGDLKLVGTGKQQWMIHILQEIRQIHRSLCNVARNINGEFSLHILVTIIIHFTQMIILLYKFYVDVILNLPTGTYLDKILQTSLSTMWMTIHTTRVLLIIYTCSTTVFEARRTGLLVYDLLTPTSNDDIRKEIHTFSLQIIQQPLEFTACEYFTVDFRLIREIVGSVTTYLVIMIQMHDSTPGSHTIVSATNTTG